MTQPSVRKCQGVPQVGTRALTADELALLNRKLLAHSRARRGYRVVSWTAAAAMLICTGLLAADSPPSITDPKSLVGFVFSSVAMWMFVAGIFGTLGEVVFGFHRWSRVGFGLAWLTLGLTFLVALPHKLEATLTAGLAVLGMFGGCAAMIVRTLELRAFGSIEPELRKDLAVGNVWQFAGPSASWDADEDADEEHADDGDDNADVEPHTLEVLPRSHLVLHIDGVATTRVITLLVTGPPPDDVLPSA